MHDDRWLLVVEHRQRLLRLARRRCATPEDAEDVVQEALLRAATFTDLDEARIGQFLTSVTVRLCADTHRAADRTARTTGRLAETGPETVDPAVEACRDADVRVLTDLLHRLPDRQREVLADRAAGLSVGQISSRHALSYKATESTLSRARTAMRLLLRSALAVAGVLTGRRRRVGAALSVPAVMTLAVLGATVGWLPWYHPADPGRGDADVETIAPVRAPVRTTVRPPRAPVRVAAPRPAPGVPPVHADPDPEEVFRLEDPAGGTLTVTTTPPDETPVQKARRCAGQGVWLQAEVRPGSTGTKEGCGRAPADREGTTTLHVGTDSHGIPRSPR